MSTLSRSSRRPLALMLGGLLLAGAGAFSMSAQAAGPGTGPGPGYGPGYGPGAGMGPGHGPGMMMHGGPGMGMQGGGRYMERMLDQVNATAEQRTQIRSIMQAARDDVRKIHEGAAALREQSRQLWSQPNIDANAAEALRKQQLAVHDQVSQRMLRARLDASTVLTPEQRKLMAERMAQRQAMMQRHRAERQSLDGVPPGRR